MPRRGAKIGIASVTSGFHSVCLSNLPLKVGIRLVVCVEESCATQADQLFQSVLSPRIVKSLFGVGLYGAEVGGMSDQYMKDLWASGGSARGALGAALRRSAALELMAQIRLAAGKATCPF
eukprot:2812505-Amphidinium_carterae.1